MDLVLTLRGRMQPHRSALILLALNAGVALAHAAPGDAGRGAGVFDSQCAECHSLKEGKNKKGPSLFASFGRKAGTVADFVYSEPMKQSGIVWTADRLAAYLASPKTIVPGGKMKLDEPINQQDIADVIAFLAIPRAH